MTDPLQTVQQIGYSVVLSFSMLLSISHCYASFMPCLILC